MDSIFGELEQFGAEVIYPYRWWFALVALLALAGAGYIAYQRRLDRVVAAHWVLALAITVPVLVVGIPAGYYLLSPLWERTTLIEVSPEFDRNVAGVATATPVIVATEAGADATAEPSEPTPATKASQSDEPMARLAAVGTWSGADDFHFAEGEALIIETEPGTFILRVENFSVRNGPDLFVYLSPGEDDDGALNLGELRATDGAFNYEIPDGVDVTQFRNAIVWCKQFSVLFGSAPLEFVAD